MHTTETLEIKYLSVLLTDSKFSLVPMQPVYPKPASETYRKKQPEPTTSSGGGLCWENLPTLSPFRRPSHHSRHICSWTSSTMLLAWIQARSSEGKRSSDLCQLLVASTNFFLHTKTS